MKYSELIKTNNLSEWDWISWETLGNPAPHFQKGDIAMQFGLWRADYFLLCQKGEKTLADKHQDALGRGWARIHTIAGFDYRPHAALIKTFLPFMTIDPQNGTLIDPLDGAAPDIDIPEQYWIVMPYNYDDNGAQSKALGTNLSEYMRKARAFRIETALTRWSTASRSGVALMLPEGAHPEVKYTYQKKYDPTWTNRKTSTDEVHIFGGKHLDETRTRRYWKALTDEPQPQHRLYTVKTGVQYVGTEDQSKNGKWIIKETERGMKHSELIDLVRKTRKDNSFEARYQIEILNVQLDKSFSSAASDASWDGFQVRDIGPTTDEVWFPALAIPGSGKAFAHAWLQDEQADWLAFWKNNFAIPLGRGKAEMLAFFGFQHQTSNAQNMVIAFDRSSRGSKSKCLILRDLGDTLLNDHAYAVLCGLDEKLLGKQFQQMWSFGTDHEDGLTLNRIIDGGYANALMTRIGTVIVFFFGPFEKGDFEKGAAQKLTTLGLALNDAFLQYFKDKLGYAPDWQGANSDDPPKHFLDEIRKCAADMKLLDGYKECVQKVLELHSRQRQKLIASLLEAADKLHADEPNTARHLVGAHDMLIGAEVECYLKSPSGRQRLQEFHRNSRRD